MILLNKTMMCGGLVVLSPGSPSQVVCAILIMMFHMLLVLKTAPYIKDSEDWSSFAASLGLTLMYMGAMVQMLQSQRREEFDREELSYAGIAMDVLPIVCVSTVIVIMIFVDCGLANHIHATRCGKRSSSRRRGDGGGRKKKTHVVPEMSEMNEKKDDSAAGVVAAGTSPPPPPPPPSAAVLTVQIGDNEEEPSKSFIPPGL